MRLIISILSVVIMLCCISCNTASSFSTGETRLNTSSKNAGTTESNTWPQKVNNSVLEKHDYINWVENEKNGLRVNKSIDEIRYSAFYKPYQYLTAVDCIQKNVSKSEYENSLRELDGYQYFTFRIQAENNVSTELLKHKLKSADDYYKRIEYCSFNMQNDLRLIENNDTLNCALFHYERVYGLAPYATFVVGFPKSGKSDLTDKTLLFDDKLFGNGLIYLTVKSDDLINIPELLMN